MIANPVFRRELFLRFRMRQSRPAFIGALITILLLVGWLYWMIFDWLYHDHSPGSGQTAWQIVASIQHLLICLIAPSITANAITQEKEQQTWEMLVFTRLEPSDIILGKLFARYLVLIFILLLFLPISIFCCLHANSAGSTSGSYVSLATFAAAYLVMMLSALFFATFGLFASWLLKRTLYAIMASYTLVIGGLCLTTVIVTYILSMVFTDSGFIESCPIMWLNPIMLLIEAFQLNAPNSSSSPMYLVMGLLFYVAFTVLMLWRMIASFRRFVYE